MSYNDCLFVDNDKQKNSYSRNPHDACFDAVTRLQRRHKTSKVPYRACLRASRLDDEDFREALADWCLLEVATFDEECITMQEI